MRKKTLRLSESELVNLVKNIVNEQGNLSIDDLKRAGKPNVSKQTAQDLFKVPQSKYGNSVGSGMEWGQKTIQVPTKMDGSLFLNGIDKIDTNSDAFQKGVQSIKSALSKTGNKQLTIDIEGGASAVGKKEGYDNDALAKRRAQNFINAVSPIFPNVKFNSPTSKVGKATVKNSPEANLEQYVKISFLVPGLSTPIIGPAVDNTQQVMRLVKDLPKVEPEKIKTVELVRVCFLIPKSSLSTVGTVVDKIGGKQA